MYTFTKYTKYTRSSPRRPDLATLPGTRGRGRGGRCKIARTQAARARWRELQDSRQ
jgi:hypothetical protein